MRRFVLLLASLMFMSRGMADNTLSINNVSGHPGDVVQVTISLDNADPVVALQVKLELNDNLKYVDGSASLSSERSNGHSLSTQYKDGALSLYLFSFSNKQLQGVSGNILSFNLKLGNEPATYSLTPSIIASNSSGTALDISSVNGSVTLLSPKITVVTETVDYGHVPIRSEYTQSVTIRNSGNEILTVNDVQPSVSELSIDDETSFSLEPGNTRSLTVRYNPVNRGGITEFISFLSNAVNGIAKARVVADPFSVNELHVSSASGLSDSEVEISLTMNNMEPIAAVQCVFNLPEALKYVEGSLTLSDRASALNKSALVSGRKLSLFIYSINNTPINGNNGEIATFRLKLDGRSGSYSINPESVILSNSVLENMMSSYSEGWISIQSPAIYCSNSLDMGRQKLTQPATASFPITNNGQIELSVNNVNFLSNGFRIAEELPFTIPAWQTRNITVCYDATKEGQFGGIMNIYSNDPENRLVSVNVSGIAYEPNGISLSGQFINECQDYCLNIGLDNYTDIVAVQMDLNVPDGLDCSSSDLVGTSRIQGLNRSITKISDGKYRILVFSMNNTSINDNAGDILTLTLHVSDQFADGQNIYLSDIILSDIRGKNYSSEANTDYLLTYPEYTVTYILDGQVCNTQRVNYGDVITPVEAPGRIGSTFAGWSGIPATMPAHDIEVTGSYTVNSYRLIYVVEGEVYKTVPILYGASVTVEPEPTKEGYSFSGWSEIPSTMPANDIIVTGLFDRNTYSLIYTIDGEFYKSVSVLYGAEIVPEEEPAREGYTFSGWSDFPSSMPASDVEITGSFSVNSYNLVYKVNDVIYKSLSVAYGSSIVPETAPVMEGYTFSGWSGIPATMPANDVEITGFFSVNSYNLIYIVDGATIKTVTLEYGSAITADPVPVREGYTFSGWSEIPATMPAGDVEISGSFSINSYNLLYKLDGELYKLLSVTYGSDITAEVAPVKEGYTFGGWSEIPVTMPANDVEITGSFSVNSYNLIYKVDGVMYKSSTVVYGSEITAEPAPYKEGYTFSGWSVIPSTMPAGDVEITGTFSINSYNLVYIVDGVTYKTATVKYGSILTAESSPVKEGYTFSGWSEIPSTMPASDIEIIGSFSVNSYNLVYKVDGELYKTMSLDYGSSITAEIAPVKEGYTFSGWSEIPSTMPASDVEINGTFSINSYSLVYKVDGETYRTTSLNYGSSITAEPAPFREGYTFSGWSEIPSTMPASDVEITGTFSVNSYNLVYKVDGEPYKTLVFNYGSSITAEPDPTREGYTFSGWSGLLSTMPASDVEITGTFSVNSYSLVYKVDGATYKSISVVYGSEIIAEVVPVREGYTFTGWSEIPSIMPANDVEITGNFSINSYNLVYKVDGNTYKITSFDYGSSIAAEPEPAKNGYTFSGWSTIPSTMPAGDVEITGSFSVNSYRLVYKVDGATYKSISVVYGSEIIAELAPTKEGYTFSGWSDIPAFMPASDVEITGSFSVNSYNLVYTVDGEPYKTLVLNYGASITAEPDPTREGYTFSGWSGLLSTMPASDVEITGTFSVNSYSLVYKVDGTTYKSLSVVYGSDIIAEVAPVKEGYTFSGWSDIPTTMPANDVEIAGTFSVNSYNLVYKVDGETYKILTVEYGISITPELEPTKGGFTFSGWSGLPSIMPANDVEITGTFSVNSYRLVYKVDGAAYKSLSVVYGSEITAEPSPVREGYTFSGWSEIPSTMPANDVEIIGTFSVNSYNLVYKVDGETYKTMSLDYGSSIMDESIPVREGYTFSGWSEIPVTMPSNDVEIIGTFSVNSYRLVYKVDGATYKSLSVVYGSEITVEPSPVREGYTFSGWSTIPSTMPSNDVEITGTFSVNSYNLVYIVDGETYKTMSLDYGSSIIAESAPVKEGYTFSGWSTIPSTMPANDVEITGTFSINSYRLVYKVDDAAYKSISVVYGSEIIAEIAPVKEGYIFSGWSAIPATMPSNNVEITGTFSVNSYNLVYIVDGEIYKSLSIEYGSSIIAESEPVKEGSTFSGWSGVPSTMPARDVEITGSFDSNSYKLIYKLDGEIYKSSIVKYGSEITAEPSPVREGYTFSGWSEIPTTMPASYVEISGTFSVNSYNLVYIVDGETYKTLSLDYGSSIIAEATPVRAGYTFSGWSTIPSTMPANDVEITGTFSINTYRLVYKVDGTTYKSLSVVYENEITAVVAPTKEGYTFSGWSEIPSTMPASDVEITGTFSVNSYNLVYKVDGETYKTTSFDYGSSITVESEPVKEGCTFSGWSTIPSTMPANDVEITGSFSINSYRLVYKVDGATYKSLSVVYGSEITTEVAPVKDGYTFSGWSEIPATMPSNDVEISGTFSVNSYNLVYIVDGETYKTMSIDYGSSITAEPDPTREGYTFSGWSGLLSTMPAGDVEITGTFSVNSYSLVYKIDGTAYKSLSVVYGSVITAEPAPVREGYTFSGWSTIPSTMPANDVEISGTFSVNSYNLVYKVDGDIYKTLSLDYGLSITAESAPVREGYTFSGWSHIPVTMPANNVEIIGSFSVNTYRLVYKIDGETYKSLALNYASSITAEPTPVKEGYTFSGWSEIPSTMPASDVEITGSFSVNSYNLVYMVDGETYKTLSLNYGSSIIAEATPVREGYTFNGWSEIPYTMPASDVEIIGTFSVNSYNLVYKVDGATYKSLSVVYGSEITPEVAPTREGSTFSGWSEIPVTMPSNNVEITGTFSVNSYNLVYIVDGEIYKSLSIEYGSSIIAESEPVKEGSTFSGWSGVPSTMPARDVEITGSFDSNAYKLIYKLDGEIYKSSIVKYGSEITAEPAPVWEGYTFSGWSEIPSTMPSSDVEITGTFSVNSYNLVYKVDGETYKTLSLDYGSSITAESAPVREGYTFSGWSMIPSTMPANDVEITGTFSINSYRLVYKVDGATYKSMSVVYGSAITAEIAPTKEGYTFSGWSEIPSTMPSNDVEITGTFSVNSYNLVYKVDGEIYKTMSLDYGSPIIAEPYPVKDGSTFSGWSDIPATMPAGDVEITGSFDSNSYRLIYKLDGVLYKSSIVIFGSSITAEPAPAKEGYTFNGWSEIPATMPANDVEVSGSFSINSYMLTYKIDGEVYMTLTAEYGSSITAEPAPVKEGYTFSGWNDIPATMPASDVEITGTFSVNSYNLVYKIGDETYKTTIVEYGSSIIAEPNPEKEGYTFSGWSEIPSTMPASDVVISGSLSINSYNLVYKVDGETYLSIVLQYGSSIAAEPDLSKEGYTFSGWSEIPTIMPANDVEVTGYYLINSYNLIYVIEGEEYKTITVEYGSSITPEPFPSKEGYTFSGWSDIPDIMPAKDVIVTGLFNCNTYSLVYMLDGEFYKSISVSFGSEIIPETEPVKDGYTFSGWSEIPSVMPAGDIVVSGLFYVNYHELRYKIDGEIYKTDSVAYGSTITAENAPVIVGYTFSGWDCVPETMPDHDVEISGSFTVNKYLLCVLVDGDVVFSDSIAFGTRLADYADIITKNGIDLSQWEWYGQIETITMPAHDVTINAVLDAVHHVKMGADESVIYDLTGKRIETDDITTLPAGIYIRGGRKFIIK